ncbi:unnamed protein product [Parajaminaea phylloscopi]
MPPDSGDPVSSALRTAGVASVSPSEVGSMQHFWTQAAAEAEPAVGQIRRRLPHFPSAPLRIQRVSQLDAEVLDDELLSLLVQPLKTSLAQIRSTLPDRIEPELYAVLKLILFKYSIWDHGATYGAMLQNLRYRNEWAHRGGLQSTFVSAPLSLLQLSLYPLLTIGIPYLNQRLERHMTSLSLSSAPPNDPRRIARSLLDKTQRVYEAAALLNFAAFLSDGRFRTVTDRLLGMRLTYNERTLNRNVSFEFLNRQLVWHAFTEFLLFLLPIIRPRRLLKKMLRLPAHPKILAFWLSVLPSWLARRVGLRRDAISGRPSYRFPLRIPFLSSANERQQNVQAIGQGKYASLPDGICAICWERIEADASAASSSAPMGNVGIPSSDPLDPSSGAFAPSSAATSSASSTLRTSNYHNASRAFGVSADGIPYSNALAHTPYAADPCGCEYCYVCLAEKLLSEEAGEELEESRAAAPSPGQHRRPSEKSSSHSASHNFAVVGAWECLRCASKVSGMHRAVHDDTDGQGGVDDSDVEVLEEDVEDQPTQRFGEAGRQSLIPSGANSHQTGMGAPAAEPQEADTEDEELDLGDFHRG